MCENSPRFHQIVSKKGPKSKFFRPRTPLVCHMLCTQIHTCPPQQPIQSHFAPLGKKLKETLSGMSVACTLQVILTLSHSNVQISHFFLYTLYALSYAKPHLLCFVQNKAGPSSYRIAGNFRGLQFSRKGNLQRFCGLIFADGHSITICSAHNTWLTPPLTTCATSAFIRYFPSERTLASYHKRELISQV